MSKFDLLISAQSSLTRRFEAQPEDILASLVVLPVVKHLGTRLHHHLILLEQV
jgi:hypothetical protein